MVEKNGKEGIGGRLNELVMDGGFRFDTGEKRERIYCIHCGVRLSL